LRGIGNGSIYTRGRGWNLLLNEGLISNENDELVRFNLKARVGVEVGRRTSLLHFS
jgi:hypothetical protein